MNKVSYSKLFETLIYFLDKDKKKFLIWNIPIILAYTYSMIEPILIGLIIDFFTQYSFGQPLTTFYKYLGFLLFGAILSTVFRISARGAMFAITADLEYNIKTKGFDNILNNSLSWQHNENSGNKIQRIETGKAALLDLVELIKSDIYRIIISLIGIIGIFIAINPLFLLFFAIYATLQLLIFRYWNSKNPEYLSRLNKARELSVGKLFEGLSNIQTIKSLGASQSFQTTIDSTQKELRESIKSYERLGVYKWISISSFDILFMVIFFLLVGYSVINGSISVGFIFVLYTYFGKLQSITGDFTNKFGKLVEIQVNVDRMLPLFESFKRNTGNKKFPARWSSIILNNASFEYPQDNKKVVFKELRFEVKRGDFVGIMGESGSGKSSLLKVLLGLYSITDGEYLIGKTNFYDILADEILENMSVVLQETELFNVSLLENITMFKEVNAKLLETAVKTAMLKDVIQELPEGLNTNIGEKGVKLSGGQRQRIGIARAIYKNSPILILDEATSNLDYETESKVMREILKLHKSKTIIVIAHRLSTLKGADKVYKFEVGRLTKNDGKSSN